MKLDKNYKVRVTPEHSKKIHDLSTLGCPVITNYLTVNMNGFVNITNSQYLFEKSEFTEIQADDLIALLTDLSKSAENPLQEMELTPEFEAQADNSANIQDNSANIQDMGTDILDTNTGIKDTHKFEIGDKVYFDLSGRIAVIDKLDGSNDFCINNSGISEGLMKSVCLATQENYERLQATFPDIEFEKPPQPLTGSDLARALFKKGWVGFNCLCGHSGDENAITDTIVTGINNDGQFTTIDGQLFRHAVPMKGWRPLQAREVGL